MALMARWRTVRTDWHTHEKTQGLSPLARDLCVQAWTDNLAAILERSVRAMAKKSGGPPGRETTPAQVKEAIAELTDPHRNGGPIAVWWPDLEILWCIEAADEQAKGVKAWEGAEAVVLAAPSVVRRAFIDRYRDRCSDRLVRSYPMVEDRTPITGRGEAPTLPDPVPDPDSVPDPARADSRAPSSATGTDLAAQPAPQISPVKPSPIEQRANAIQTRANRRPFGEAALREWRQYGRPGGLGPWPSPKPPGNIARQHPLTLHPKALVLLDSVSAEELHEFAHDLAAAVEAGAFPWDKHRAHYVFDVAWFETVRAQVDAWKTDAPATAPPPAEKLADAFLEQLDGGDA